MYEYTVPAPAVASASVRRPFADTQQHHPNHDHAHNHTHIPRQRARSYAPPPRPPVKIPLEEAEDTEDPWAQMATTYAWVVEQQLDQLASQTAETRRWVREQQANLGILRDAKRTRAHANAQAYPRVVVETRREPAPPPPLSARRRVYSTRAGGVPYGDADLDAEIAQFAARTREARKLAQRQEERNRMLQEEFGRMEARWKERSERTQRRIAEERRRADEQRQRAQVSERWMAERTAEAWLAYEERWAALAQSEELLTFRTIPWPLLGVPRAVDDITADAVARFVLSPVHSQGLAPKDRIRNALRRWHPDRFGRLMGRVATRDKAVVEAGVGAVARCLNELMERR
ncbi:hypothetical protein DENSPDRAFT_843880 [Dentipellis sp. KUC8613]|nr:hypothetical protein DENSPDRAFT_843880 [Dentipellis sp. KUC8613]